MNTDYKAMLKSTNNHQHTVSDPLDVIINRINEIAVVNCIDYPRIKTCKPIEQLYAIEQSMVGICETNNDLHKVITKLREKLNMTLPQYLEFIES